jgi:transposase
LKRGYRVGVDVSAKELVVAMETAGRREAPIVLSNDAEGHRKLVKLATKRGASAQVVLESTGTYGLDLALALHRAKRSASSPISSRGGSRRSASARSS